MAALPLAAYTAIAGAGSGVAKQAAQKKAYESQKQLAAKTAEYSPWTGLSGMDVLAKAEKPQGLFGNVLGGGLSGANLGSQVSQSGWFGGSKPEDIMGGMAQKVSGGAGQGMDVMAGGYEQNPLVKQQPKMDTGWSHTLFS